MRVAGQEDDGVGGLPRKEFAGIAGPWGRQGNGQAGGGFEAMPYAWLSAQKALVFRITHIDNVRWTIDNGLHCRNGKRDTSFVTIGEPGIIDRRNGRRVPVGPGGTLSDYIPFYFTPFSPMAYNIKTGVGVTAVASRDIVVFVASLRRLAEEPEVQFLYTDRHAVLEWAAFHESLDDLDCLDWPRLRNRDFKRDNNEPEKMERYQAEALVYRRLPLNLLQGIACWGPKEAGRIEALAEEAGVNVRVVQDSRVYF